MSKSTPGPWEASEHGDYSDYDGECIVILGMDTRICVVQGSDDSETYHNAHLIAAAPDLLEACKAIVRFQEVCDSDATSGLLATYGEAYEKAKAAIAKARGEG